MNNYSTNQPDPNAFFKLMTIIHAALLMGQLLFAAVVIFLLPQPANSVNKVKADDNLFLIVAVFLTLLGIFMGAFLFKQQLAKLPEKNTLREKLAVYQTGMIIRYALVQGASLFAIVCYMLSYNPVFLGIIAINIGWFVWLRPTKSKAEDDLNLSYDEKLEMGI